MIISIGSKFDFYLSYGTSHPDCQIYLFDPIPEIIELFQNKIKNISNIYLIQKAVTDNNGVSKFNISHNNYELSSLLEFSENANNCWLSRNDFIFSKNINVDTIRLDSFIKQYDLKEEIEFIDICGNGTDLSILYGLGQHIDKVKAGSLFASLNPESIYKKQNCLDESMNFLKIKNFVIQNIEPMDYQGNIVKIYFNKISV